MDGIQLKQCATKYRFWPLCIVMRPLPRTSFLPEMAPIECALHGRERDLNSLLLERIIHMLGTASSSDTLTDDRLDGLRRQSSRAHFRSRRFCRYRHPSRSPRAIAPTGDRARFNTNISSDLSHAPPTVFDEPYGLHAHLWEIRILCVHARYFKPWVLRSY